MYNSNDTCFAKGCNFKNVYTSVKTILTNNIYHYFFGNNLC